jgi:glycosyltransferase involved in cell wall biosynthesis
MGFLGEVAVIPNAVDLDKFLSENWKFSKEEIKKRLNISQNEKIIISVSRLVKKNGIVDLIRAMNFLPDNFKLLIAGKGEERNNLEKEIKKLKLEKRIVLLGHILPDNIPEYLSVSDIFVRPSLSEGLGNVFLEAMAAGLPVIGTNVGGIPDFLKDNETGLFCKVKNPVSIAQKIKLLLDDAVLRQKLIDNGRRLVEEKYDWDKIVLQMKEIFNKLIINK